MNQKVCLSILTAIVFFSYGCNLLNPKEDTPLGTSTMIATIQGVVDTFSNVVAANYFGSGTSNGYTLRINLGDGRIGNHKWGKYSGPNTLDSSATLNWMPALLDIGGFAITNHDTGNRLFEGTFNFSVFDTTNKDTITVQNGHFSFYYIQKE